MGTTKQEIYPILKFNPIQNIGLPSNMYFGKGCEIDNQHHFTLGNLRWCIFTATGAGFYLIKQEQEDGEWYEIWTKKFDCCTPMHKVLDYARSDIKNNAFELVQAIVNFN